MILKLKTYMFEDINVDLFIVNLEVFSLSSIIVSPLINVRVKTDLLRNYLNL